MGAGGSGGHELGEHGPSADPRFEEALAGIRQGEVQNAELTGQLLGPPEIEKLCEAFSCSGSVKALELDNNMIGHEGAARLAETLAGDSNICLVDLTGNGIGDAGATSLAARLGGNCALRHLDLTRNTIKGDGGLALGRMLTVNSGIRQLTVSENMVGAEGARAIGLALPDNQSLQILNLRKCGLGPKGARFIAQGLNKNAVLTELSVGMNHVMDVGAAEFAEMIRINRSMRDLYLEDNDIEGFGAKLMAEALRSNDCLETLWMVGNYLSIDVIARFAQVGFQSEVPLRCLGIECAEELPSAVMKDLKRMRRKMIDRKRTRALALRGKCQDSLGSGSSWDGESQAAQIPGHGAARGRAGARECSRGPRVSPRLQQIVSWNDHLEIEELLEMENARTPRVAEADVERGRRKMIDRKRTSALRGKRQDSLGSDSRRDDESQAAQIQGPGAAQGPASARECSRGSREAAPPERLQQVVSWDDELQLEELLGWENTPRRSTPVHAADLQICPVHASLGTPKEDSLVPREAPSSDRGGAAGDPAGRQLLIEMLPEMENTFPVPREAPSSDRGGADGDPAGRHLLIEVLPEVENPFPVPREAPSSDRGGADGVPAGRYLQIEKLPEVESTFPVPREASSSDRGGAAGVPAGRYLQIEKLPEVERTLPVHRSLGTALVDISADPPAWEPRGAADF